MDIATPKTHSGDICCDLSVDSLSYRNPLVVQKCRSYINGEVTVNTAPTESLAVSSLNEDGKLIIQELGNSFCGKLQLNDSCEQHGKLIIQELGNSFCGKLQLNGSCERHGQLIIQELGNSFRGKQQLNESCEQLSGSDANLNQEEGYSVDIGVTHQKRGSIKVGQSLKRATTFPLSREVCPNPASIKGSQDPDSSKSDGPAYVRSMSMPASAKLVSAMKGGREQSGISIMTNLHVKWAPDVYDPPATSVDHTVKGHRQSPKFRKKDQHKQKLKGKNSRGKGREKSKQIR